MSAVRAIPWPCVEGVPYPYPIPVSHRLQRGAEPLKRFVPNNNDRHRHSNAREKDTSRPQFSGRSILELGISPRRAAGEIPSAYCVGYSFFGSTKTPQYRRLA